MSRLVKVPVGKQIKPLTGPFILKGGKTYELQQSWILPEVYTDGSPIATVEAVEKVEIKEVKHAPKEAKPKAKKRVKKTTTEAPKVETPREEESDA